MRVLVNGVGVELAAGSTVADVVAVTCPSAKGVAVAVDREVVPRSSWDRVTLHEGGRVEVVEAAAGG